MGQPISPGTSTELEDPGAAGFPRIDFLEAPFDLAGADEVMKVLEERTDRSQFGYVVTPNVDHVVRLAQRPDLLPAYRAAWMSWCDSRPLHALARLSGVRLPHLTGADMTVRILTELARPGDRIACILAEQGLLEELRLKFPALDFVGHCPPMGLDSDSRARGECLRFLVQHPARFVFIGIGAPRSELLALEVMSTGRATGTAFCVGASLEFAVGRKRRAPRFLRAAGLEWVHRLACEPKRLWRRYAFSAFPLLGLYAREIAMRRKH